MDKNGSTQQADAYYRIQVDGSQLEHFWDLLNQQFDAALPEVQIRHLQVAGQSIRLECRSPCLLSYADIQLACCLAKESDKPNAVFRVWQDEIASCLPPDCPVQKVLIVKDQFLAIKAEKDQGRLHGFDPQRNIGYFCLQNDHDQAVIEQGYLLYRLFYYLAKNTGRIMLHGAVIGYENKGVLICGNCGYGKSTLALSSLLKGCQYVGDDRAMFVKKEGETFAWPVYSVASLYETILTQMPKLQAPRRWLKNASLKNILDISAYHPQFCFGLPMKALLFPKLSLEAKEPSISAIAPGPVLTHLIWSTITQVDDRKDSAHIQNMLEFFKYLPCYQLVLCADLEKNTTFLQNFIVMGGYERS